MAAWLEYLRDTLQIRRAIGIDHHLATGLLEHVYSSIWDSSEPFIEGDATTLSRCFDFKFADGTPALKVGPVGEHGAGFFDPEVMDRYGHKNKLGLAPATYNDRGLIQYLSANGQTSIAQDISAAMSASNLMSSSPAPDPPVPVLSSVPVVPAPVGGGSSEASTTPAIPIALAELFPALTGSAVLAQLEQVLIQQLTAQIQPIIAQVIAKLEAELVAHLFGKGK